MNHVSLHSDDIPQEDFIELREKSSKFQPQFLKRYGEEKNITHDCLVSALKQMVKVSNKNFLRSGNGLLEKLQIGSDNITWLGKARTESGKFKLHIIFFYFSAQNCLLYECLLKIDFLIDLVNFGEIFRRYFHLAKQDKRYKNIKQFHKILLILIVGMS